MAPYYSAFANNICLAPTTTSTVSDQLTCSTQAGTTTLYSYTSSNQCTNVPGYGVTQTAYQLGESCFEFIVIVSQGMILYCGGFENMLSSREIHFKYVTCLYVPTLVSSVISLQAARDPLRRAPHHLQQQ